MNIAKNISWLIKRRLKRSVGVPDMWNSLLQLKENNFTPLNVFDIGAYDGRWTKNCSKVFSNADYFMFEPQEHLYNALSSMVSDKIVIENLFLGERDGLEINFYEDGSGSSALRFGPNIPIKKVTTSLDSYCRKNSINSIDILKMDVQGYELNILQGAKTTLKNVQLIIAEVSLLDVYVDCPLVAEIINFLNIHHFQLFDIVDLRRRELDNNLWQCDMFFVKNDFFLLNDKRKDKKQIRPIDH